jgi:hypothetical protein
MSGMVAPAHSRHWARLAKAWVICSVGLEGVRVACGEEGVGEGMVPTWPDIVMRRVDADGVDVVVGGRVVVLMCE